MRNNIDSIVRDVTFNASIEHVWQAITCPEKIQLWFGSAASFKLKEGELGYFEWQDECEGQFAMRIESIKAPHYFAWRWMHKQGVAFDEKQSTLVEWSLTSIENGGTALTLTESGFAQAKHRQENVAGWQQELTDLENYMLEQCRMIEV
ncbi:SRPBCC domain-containing protein [Colwellia sp. 1_MG-2023]|uniref:SRPBCC domain-containing protein n=1 Tax=Colwellia sp. 1_MG-2023 TaxID=3062649 RepID=UPI0026E2F377|nr:SRPBCC domain-containing protein [Colwellia sp. 1_MG-2023]MDO6445494.1 SRPBCC domain-containing protein [Colwellia sp. 1_MG-2023]